jgi:hypothetical protein
MEEAGSEIQSLNSPFRRDKVQPRDKERWEGMFFGLVFLIYREYPQTFFKDRMDRRGRVRNGEASFPYSSSFSRQLGLQVQLQRPARVRETGRAEQQRLFIKCFRRSTHDGGG